MDSSKKQSGYDRRAALKLLGLGSATGLLGMFGSISSATAAPRGTPSYAKGMVPIKIKSVKAIGTAPREPTAWL